MWKEINWQWWLYDKWQFYLKAYPKEIIFHKAKWIFTLKQQSITGSICKNVADVGMPGDVGNYLRYFKITVLLKFEII